MANTGSKERESALPAEAAQAEDAFQSVLQDFFAESADPVDEGEAGAPALGPAVARGSLDQREFLSFRLAEEDFAIPIEHIREIIKPPPITPVPRVPPVILGVLSLRGTVVPIIDLRRRLKLPEGPRERRNRVLIVRTEEEPIGLLVDEVRQVVRFRSDQIEPPPAVFGRGESDHLLGVGRHEGEMITLLHIGALLSEDLLAEAAPKGKAHG